MIMADRNNNIVRYFQEGLSYRQISDVLLKTHGVSISVRQIHRVLRRLDLKRRNYTDIKTVIDFILNELGQSGGLHGYRMLRQRCLANGLNVRTSDVCTILQTCDTEDVKKISTETNYANYSKVYDNARSAAGSDVICAFLQFYTGRKLHHLNVLDAGSGTGTITKALIEHGVGNVSLVDASEDMLDLAKAKLAGDIQSGTVSSIVHSHIPPIPFPDASFDAVVFNLYFYLEGSRNDQEHSQTLKEARRLLKPGGVILISSLLWSTVINMWLPKLDKALGGRFVSKCPPLQWYDKMFNEVGISCIQTIQILGSDIIPKYFESPDGFIESYLYFLNATNDERLRVYQTIGDLKQKGEFQQWVKDHDKTTGLLTVFVCR